MYRLAVSLFCSLLCRLAKRRLLPAANSKIATDNERLGHKYALLLCYCCCSYRWWWWQLQRYHQTAAVGSGMPLSHLCFEFFGQASGATSSPHIMLKYMQANCCCNCDYFFSCTTYAFSLLFLTVFFCVFPPVSNRSAFLCLHMLLSISLRFELSGRKAYGILDSIHNCSAFNYRSGLILWCMEIENELFDCFWSALL